MLEKQSAKVFLEECFLNFTGYKIDQGRLNFDKKFVYFHTLLSNHQGFSIQC